MMRTVTVTWWNDDHDEKIRFEKDMETDELVDFMRDLEKNDFEAVED